MPILYNGGFGANRIYAKRWRIVVTGVTPGDATIILWPMVGELAMATTPGGANICPTGTPFGTVDSLAHSYTKAFDNDPSTYARSGVGGFGLVLGCVFPTDVNVVEIRLTCPTTSLLSMTSAFVPQYSQDDGATWHACDPCGPFTAWTAGMTQAFAVRPSRSVSRPTAKIWGFTGLVGTSLSELKLQVGSGGPSLMSGGAFLQTTSTNGGVTAAGLFDNNTTTRWQGNPPMSAQYVFANAPNPTHITLKATGYPYGNGNSAFTQWELWWTLDGTTKNTVLAMSGETPFADWEERTYAF